jgi:hypothetical protein
MRWRAWNATVPAFLLTVLVRSHGVAACLGMAHE